MKQDDQPITIDQFVIEKKDGDVLLGKGEFATVLKSTHKSGKVFAIKIVL